MLIDSKACISLRETFPKVLAPLERCMSSGQARLDHCDGYLAQAGLSYWGEPGPGIEFR